MCVDMCNLYIYKICLPLRSSQEGLRVELQHEERKQRNAYKSPPVRACWFFLFSFLSTSNFCYAILNTTPYIITLTSITTYYVVVLRTVERECVIGTYVV